MKKLNYAIIGFGGIAENRIAREGFARDTKRFRPLRHAVLVGASDVSLARRSTAEALGLKWYDSAEAVCADATIDGVFIATNNRSHYPIAKMAIEAGKHVLVEKPLTTSLQYARELVALAERHNVSLAVDHMMLHNAFNIKAKQLIRRGELGMVENIILHMEFPYGFTPEEAATWRCADPEEVGGPVGDVASHCLYMAEFLLGETITSVRGVYTPPVLGIRVENGAFVKFTTDRGTPGTVRVSFSEQRGSLAATLLNLGYEIYGARKTLRSYGTLFQLSGHPGESILQRLELDDGRTVKKVKVSNVRNIYRAVVENHAKSAADGARCTGEDAVHNLDLVVSVHRSAQANGRPIQIPSQEGD